VTLWVRSYFSADQFIVSGHDRSSPRRTATWGFGLLSAQGGIGASFTRTERHWDDEAAWQRDAGVNAAGLQSNWSQGPAMYPRWTSDAGWRLAGFQVSRRADDLPGSIAGTFHSRSYGIVLPNWAPCLVTLPLPTVRLRRHLRLARRARLGQCPRCGYDLRGTPGGCPECGTIVAPTTTP
jgi:hypothetical protein